MTPPRRCVVLVETVIFAQDPLERNADRAPAVGAAGLEELHLEHTPAPAAVV
jgi:hypothetical protein